MTREVGYTNALYYALRGSYLTKKKAKIILYSERGEKNNFKRLKETYRRQFFKKRKFKQEKQIRSNRKKKKQIKFTSEKIGVQDITVFTIHA